MKAAVDVLRNIEWSGAEYVRDDAYPCCPICDGIRPGTCGIPNTREGHTSDCKLNAALQEHAPPAPQPPDLGRYGACYELDAYRMGKFCEIAFNDCASPPEPYVLVTDSTRPVWILRPKHRESAATTPTPPELPPHIAAEYEHCDPPEFVVPNGTWPWLTSNGTVETFVSLYGGRQGRWDGDARRWKLRRRQQPREAVQQLGPLQGWQIKREAAGAHRSNVMVFRNGCGCGSLSGTVCTKCGRELAVHLTMAVVSQMREQEQD